MTRDRLATRVYRLSPLTRAARNMLRKVNRAIDRFGLLSDDDRVCVAVSGGKDSLSLLHLLTEHRRFYNLRYALSAVHVVSDFAPEALKTKDYIEHICVSLDVPCTFIPIQVTVGLDGEPANPTCFWCAWKRREALFHHTKAGGFTKLALAHHADDSAETTLLNLVFHGNLDTMLPARSFFDGAFTLIRPLFYVRERDLVRYSGIAGFQAASCECPNAETSMRAKMKALVSDLSKDSRLLHENLRRASLLWREAFGDRPLHKDGTKALRHRGTEGKTENREKESEMGSEREDEY